MDNFFEILIYLFIIVTFLSSVFKKKKPVPEKPQPQARQQTEDVDIIYSPESEMESSSIKSSSTDEYDILKELEQFFKVGEPQKQPAPKPKPPVIPQPVKVEPKRKPVEDSWRTKTESEHKYEDLWEKKRRDVAERKKEADSLASLQSTKFEELLKTKKVYSTAFERNIKQRLKQPSSLKEYIVISEILGKPKALKRR